MTQHSTKNEENITELRLTVLLHQDGKAWVAQCLEHDVAAQGPSRDECKRRFMHTLTAQILTDLKRDIDPLSELGQAPARYFDDSLLAASDGPELPVYVPVPTPMKLKATARFLGDGGYQSAPAG